MADQEYDNTDRGAAFNADGYKVIKQGHLHFGSTQEYITIVHKDLGEGREFIEVYMKIGGLKVKPDHERKSDKSPNIVGGVTYKGTEYHLSGWKQKSSKGRPFTSLSLTLKNQDSDGDGGSSESGSEPSSTDYDDEIPF